MGPGKRMFWGSLLPSCKNLKCMRRDGMAPQYVVRYIVAVSFGIFGCVRRMRVLIGKRSLF